jgi:rhodanese-related sulfurtransferase
MAFLSRIFGRKPASPAPAPDNDELDITALKPLMQPQDFEIKVGETAALLKAGKIKLLDVRTPEEFAIARVEGSVLLDQNLMQEMLKTWPKDTPIVTMCHHGVRSLDAAAYLRDHGFADTKSMSGGIDRWSREIDPSVPLY